MGKEGELAGFLAGLTAEWLAEHGRNAREAAVKRFATDVVIGRYIEYYQAVLGADE
jgi:hypothetical protein